VCGAKEIQDEKQDSARNKTHGYLNKPDILKESNISSINESIIIKPAAKPIKKTKRRSPGFLIRTTSPPRAVPKPARVLSKIITGYQQQLHHSFFISSKHFQRHFT